MTEAIVQKLMIGVEVDASNYQFRASVADPKGVTFVGVWRPTMEAAEEDCKSFLRDLMKRLGNRVASVSDDTSSKPTVH